MRRLLLVACLLLGTALPAAGQGGFTTVTGTIVGAVDGLTWSCGTISAQLITAGGAAPTLNGQGFSTSTAPVALGCPGTNALAPGSFSMRLADSGVIVPSNTTWQFTVNMTPGIAPPAGTGPQSFTYTTAINCSTNTPSTCTANSMSISVQLSALAPKLSNTGTGGSSFPVTTAVAVNSGGSITVNTGGSIAPAGTGTVTSTNPVGGTSLPATCTIGTFFFLTAVSGSKPPGQYNCIATNTYSFVGTNTGNTVNVADFGVTNAGNSVCDATSNSTTTVTTSANDPAFTSAITGWVVWGNSSCLDEAGGTQAVPVGTITFVSAHTATVSIAATQTLTGTLHLIWGPQEDTPLTNAENAAFNYAPSAPQQGVCYGLGLSNGFTVVKSPHFNTFSCNSQQTGALSRGALIFGQNRATSLIAMTPDFNLAGCPTYNSLPTCFGAANGVTKQNFGITGWQDPGNSNPAALTCIIQDAIDSVTFSFFLVGFAPSRSNVAAMCNENVNANSVYVTEDGMGGIGWIANATYTSCDICFFGGNVTQLMQTGNNNNVQLTTHNVVWGPVGSGLGVGIEFNSGATANWHSYGDTIGNVVNATYEIDCSVGSTCVFDGLTQNASAPSQYGPFFTAGSTGGHFLVSNSTVQSGSGTVSWIWHSSSAGALFDDMGGNRFSCTAGQCLNDTGGAAFRTIVGNSTWSNAPPAGSTNCASSAAPAVCGSWFDGSAVIAAAATTVTINTIVVGANSIITLTPDDTLGTKLGVTCNSTIATLVGGLAVTTRTPGTSFQVTSGATPAVNPLCFNFSIRATN
jgi:hypothetical protein